LDHRESESQHFCRCIASQWANDLIWSEFSLLILLPLPKLTEDRYPKSHCTPIDLVQKEYFSAYDLSEKDKHLLDEQFSKTKVLWILDGYEQIDQKIPAHLTDLIEELLKEYTSYLIHISSI
jgi:type II restriction/modification system DNA methylase subunit YeeA